MINYVNTSRQIAMLQYEQPNILSVTRGRGTVGQLSPETILSRTQNSMLSSFFTNKIHIATEKFLQTKTHRPIYPTHKACLCHKQDGKLLRVL